MDHVEYFYVCTDCGWQLQFGDVPWLYLAEMRNEILDFLKEHEVEDKHYSWRMVHVPWVRVHR